MRGAGLVRHAVWLALGCAVLPLGCGGDSESDSSGGAGGSAGSGGGAGNGGTAGSGGTAASGGAAGSAGVAGSAGASGASGTGGAFAAGSVPCANGVCAVPDNYCCESPSGEETCVAATVSSCSGLRRSCDQTADCESGQICCPIPASAPFFVYSASCAPACDSFFPWQLCATSAECTNGEQCVKQTCNGHDVQTCGPIDPSLC